MKLITLGRALPMVALGLISLLGTSCRSKSEVSSATSADSASVAAPSANASDSCARQQLVVMSYNVENFFNPEDDPLKNDDEFTPMTSDGGGGVYNWTEDRMRSKALRIASVIVSANGWDLPDVVGLCEVEGPAVDSITGRITQPSGADLLVRYGNLDAGSLNYKAICFPVPDQRGIATALLYNATTMQPLQTMAIPISNDTLKTRDLLFAKMRELKTGQIFHFLVNHWPSKRGGPETSRPLRRYVAQKVRAVCDSLVAAAGADTLANVVLLGDFNDEADEESLTQFLGAQPNNNTCLLRNLSSDCLPQHSYKYHGKWSTIDHIIVTPGVCRFGRPRFSVVNLPFLLEPDDRNTGNRPLRTYLGRRFNYGPDGRGGYSDHLPVMVTIPLEPSKWQVPVWNKNTKSTTIKSTTTKSDPLPLDKSEAQPTKGRTPSGKTIGLRSKPE